MTRAFTSSVRSGRRVSTIFSAMRRSRSGLDSMTILLIPSSCFRITSSGRVETRSLRLGVFSEIAFTEASSWPRDCPSHSSKPSMAKMRGRSSVSRVLCSHASRVLKFSAGSGSPEAKMPLYHSKKSFSLPPCVRPALGYHLTSNRRRRRAAQLGVGPPYAVPWTIARMGAPTKPGRPTP